MRSRLVRGLAALARAAACDVGDFLLPVVCAACDQSLGLGEWHLCGACRATLDQPARPRCRRCGGPLSPLLAVTRRCPRCRGRALRFRWTAVGGAYDGALRSLILRFKYGPDPRLAALLVSLTSVRLRAVLMPRSVDALVPVPLHRRRQRLRGFNQAELLARELGAVLDLPVWNLLRRTGERPPQAGLPRRQRLHNVDQVYAPRRLGVRRARQTSLALVDDVISTGATVDACASILRALGARDVGAVAIAAAE